MYGLISHLRQNVLGYLAVALAAGGVSYAATGEPSATSRLFACVAKKDGAMRLAGKRTTCEKGERKVSWGVRGPRGRRGRTGPAGPAGSDAQFAGAAAGGALTGTYPNPQLGAGVVGSPELVDLGVGGADIADGAIGATKLVDAAVETAKLADGAVGSAKIADTSIGTIDMATGAVETEKLADNAITSAKLANQSVKATDLGRVVVRTAVAAVPDNGNVSANATCDAGEVAIGGGGSLDSFVSDVPLISSRPARSAGFFELPSNGSAYDAWRATAINPAGGTGATVSVRAHVLCLQP